MLVLPVRVCPCVDEPVNQRWLSTGVEHRAEQRRVAPPIDRVHRRARLEKDFRHIVAVLLAGEMERREALSVGRVDVGALVEELRTRSTGSRRAAR